MKLFVFIFLIFAQVSCTNSKKLVHLTGNTMGTYYSVKAYTDLDEELLKTQIEHILKEVNQVFSTYINDSEISIINQSSGEIEITPVFKEVLELSFKINKESEGLLIQRWGQWLIFGALVLIKKDCVQVMKKLKKPLLKLVF